MTKIEEAAISLQQQNLETVAYSASLMTGIG
jgi:hypothetical protein